MYVDRLMYAALAWAAVAVGLLVVVPVLLPPQVAPFEQLVCNTRPAETRTVTALVLGTVFLVFVAYRARLARPDATEAPRFAPLTHLAPAAVALLTAGLFIGIMLATSHLTGWSSVWPGNASPWPPKGAPDDLAQAELIAIYTLTNGVPGKNLAPTSGALFLWAVMYAMTIGAAVVSLWVTAGLWANCQARRFRVELSWWFAGAGLLATCFFVAIGHKDFSAGFGGFVGAVMLCGVWPRVLGGNAEHLARLSDALNVVGIAIPLAVVLGACVLLGVLGRERMDKATPVAVVKEIARASASLDVLLYVGAAALVAGTLQVSALYALTLAHVPTLADVKVKRDICRPSANDSFLQREACKDLDKELRKAERGAPLRQFAKSLTLGFGLCFSVLLGAIYLGAATPMHAYARRLILPTVNGDEANAQARLVELGIESNLIGKLGRLATTLSPLAAGLISNLLGSSG